MLASADQTTIEVKSRAFSSRAAAGTGAVPTVRASLRTLADGAMLFQDGDTRARIYRVETGAICHYINWDDGRHEVIEFAFPGDIIGFGHLDKHISNAQAMVATTLSIVSDADFQSELNADAELAARLTAAADREFDILRQRTVKLDGRSTASRVAAFLLAVSENSASEGRNGRVVTDDVDSGAAANMLRLDIEALAMALVDLEKRGLVLRVDEGLRLQDVSALQALANGT